MGNQMTAELLVKFKALQLQADTEANKKIKNRNGVVDADNKKEIKIFQDLVTKQYKEGKINDADYATLMGADFSAKPAQAPATEEVAAPAEEAKAEEAKAEEAKAEEAPVATKVNEELTGKEKRQAKKDAKDYDSHVLNFVSGYVAGNSTVTVANLVETLKRDIPGADYQASITKIENALKDIKFTDKKSVEKISKTLKDKGLSKDLANAIEDLAKREQVKKEKDELRTQYDKIVAAEEEGTKTSVSDRLEKLKTKIDKDLKWAGNSYYSTDAFKALEADLAKEVAEEQQHKMSGMTAKDFGGKEVTRKDVTTKLKSETTNDKFSKQVVKDMKDEARVVSNRINEAIAFEDLKAISRKDLIAALGDGNTGIETFNFLNNGDKLINKETGKYDLTPISKAITKAIGADHEINSYEDFKASERQQAINNINELLDLKQPNVIDDSHLEKLIKLCNIAKAPKDRSAKTAFHNALNEGIAGTALASLGAVKAEAVAVAEVGSIVVAEAGAKATIGWWAAGAPIVEIGLDALLNVIFGVENGERTCFDYEAVKNKDGSNKTVEEYEKTLASTENEEKRTAIIMLAKAYETKYKEDWNTHFINDMRKIAGNKALNCLEFSSAYPTILEGLKPEEKPVDDEHSYSQQDEEGTDPVYVNVPQIDGSKTSWAKIAQQYDCLVQKYQLQGAIRILKIAQAITDGDYSEKRLDDLYKLSLQGRKNLQNIEGFNYEIYCNKLDATYLPALEYEIDENGNKIPKVGTGIIVPEKLGECTRDASLSLEVERATGPGVVVHPHGNAGGKIKVSDGTSSKYYVRLDGNVQVWDTAVFSNAKKLRDDAVTAFKAKHPNATVEKWEEE